MKFIVFTGSMGSGKSTAITCLKELQLARVENIKFAAPLYDMQDFIYRRIQEVYPLPRKFKKDRVLLQFLGTEWGRDKISKTIWIDLWKTEIKNTQENYPYVFITCDDLRFDNEAEAVKEMGGLIIKITSNVERPGVAKGITGHASEAGVDLKYVDYVIENNGTYDELKEALLILNRKFSIW